MAQPRESARKHMKEGAADELVGVELHYLALVAVSVVAPSEAGLLAIKVDEATVGDWRASPRLYHPHGSLTPRV